MVTPSWRLVTTCAVVTAAAAIMISWAALTFGRNPLLDVANLLPPAAVLCLVALLVRGQPTFSTALLVAVIAVSVVSVLVYLAGDSLVTVVAWVLQWATAAAALIAATVAKLAGAPVHHDRGHEAPGRHPGAMLAVTLGGLVGGAILGLGLCLLVLGFDYHSFEMGGTARVSVFGTEVFSVSGIFANLVPGIVLALVCAVMGIVGATLASRLAKGGGKNRKDARAEPTAAPDRGRHHGSSDE